MLLVTMFSWFWQWSNFENRSIFDDVKAFKTKCARFLGHPIYRVDQKSKPLSLIIIKSYLNPPLWLDFSSISTIKWVQEYILVYIKYSMCNLICNVITYCVWSCDMGESNASDKIMIEDPKKRTYENKRHFYINLHIKDCYGMEFTAW